ncbi:hypothetical protein [Phytomonospora endophytica]|uniref:Uncharacterized protein n=1 Tax=Phytomonospora endophytica TaxID=714109 RepID=A0A841FF77_9ACTN|nr:hypothetical protein [Phytomonospora endophytica]MBB6034235.1 hypothetical protein [Phytomonospora endophytica]GIG66628.1 hypothetical protein Pen01_29230 [Phytomonospora endophytica]
MSAQLPEHEYLLLKYLVRFYADDQRTGRPRTTRQIAAALGGDYPGGDRAIIDTLAGYGVYFKHPARPGPASVTSITKRVTETVENDSRTSGDPSTWDVPAAWDD